MRLVDCFHELFTYTTLLIGNKDPNFPSFSVVKRDVDLLLAKADSFGQGNAKAGVAAFSAPAPVKPKTGQDWDKPTRLFQAADGPVQESTPYITIESSSGNSRLELVKPQVMVGRVATCDLQVTDDLVSRNHACFERRQAGWYIVDKNSSNGTFINNARINEQMIKNGDVVRIGSAKLVFHLPPSTKRGIPLNTLPAVSTGKQTQQLGTGGDFSLDDYNNAKFAVCAWIDEMILTSFWQGRTEWLTNTLQRRFYNTSIAGEEFIHRLGRLRPEQKAVREVYAYCLALRFSGPYFQEDRKSKSELEIIKKECFKPLLGENFNEKDFWAKPMLQNAYLPASVQTGIKSRRWREHLFDKSLFNIALWLSPVLLFVILYWIYDTTLDGIITDFFKATL